MVLTSGICSCHRTGANKARKEDTFSPAIGVCTSIDNYEQIRANGYCYIEESVKGFLIPTESEEQFMKKFTQFKEANFTVYACNNFLPSSLKSVGPDPKHDEIIAYSETAFSRANRVGIKVIVFGSSGSRRIPEGFDRDNFTGYFQALRQINYQDRISIECRWEDLAEELAGIQYRASNIRASILLVKQRSVLFS